MNWNDIIEHKDELLYSIDAFHPRSKSNINSNFTITAPMAEAACEIIRKENNEYFPRQIAENAIENKDFDTLYNILSSTWFGAPESRLVYDIPGFNFLCEILQEGLEEEVNERK